MERTDKNIGDLVLFNRSAHFAFIFQKTEKLVSAVYLVTNLISDSEPLKARIRENALALMSVVVDWNTVTASERKALLKEYQALSLEIVSYASVARHAGLISDMNFEILKREFEALMFAAEREDHVLLDASFFDAGKPASSASPANSAQAQSSAQGSAPALSAPAAQTASYLPPVPAPQKGNVLYEGHSAVHKGHSPKADSKDDRQAIIMKLLSKKSGLSVKDFVGAIKGVSEKTIQRELLSMVASGVLKKEGERRWSTYSLAK